jgi:hypothetical protein
MSNKRSDGGREVVKLVQVEMNSAAGTDKTIRHLGTQVALRKLQCSIHGREAEGQ